MAKTGELIQRILDEKGLTKAQIAARLGVSERTIDYWLEGKKEAQPRNRNELVQILKERNVNQKAGDETDYKSKVIQLQDRLLNEKSASEIEAEIEGYRIRVKDEKLLSLLSFLAIQSRLDAVSDLLLLVAGNEDSDKIAKLKKATDESETKALSEALHKLKFLGAIDF